MAFSIAAKRFISNLRHGNFRPTVHTMFICSRLRRVDVHKHCLKLRCLSHTSNNLSNSSKSSHVSNDTEYSSDVSLRNITMDYKYVLKENTESEEALSENVGREDELAFSSGHELKKITKQHMEEKFHLGEYVKQSETVSQLVELGVDLTTLQRVRGAADMIIKLDFESEIKPYLYFLHDVGVADKDMGHYISKNPLVFKESLEDLQARVSYLQSKKFPQEAIARIVTKAHVFLLMSTPQIDGKLGYLQKEYKLSGNEVRSVVTRLPKLITWNLQKLKDNRFYIKEFLGFSEAELQKLIIACPKLLLTNRYSLGRKFDYLHNTMQLDHHTLLQWPKVLLTRLHVIQQRHRFLLSVGRAQYNPEKENYVPLQSLVSGKDQDFCWTVAKCSIKQYNNFLKSI